MYDTAHVVFQPKHMSREELDRGYAWCYDGCSRTRRSGSGGRATGGRCSPYLAMCYLYKRSNRFWHLLIRHRLTAAMWRPLIEHSRRRHLNCGRASKRSVQRMKRRREPVNA